MLKGALAATALTVAAGGILFSYENPTPSFGTNASAATVEQVTPPRVPGPGGSFGFADLVEKVSPAVVSVEVEHTGIQTPHTRIGGEGGNADEEVAIKQRISQITQLPGSQTSDDAVNTFVIDPISKTLLVLSILRRESCARFTP
jgi:S1-C subfamily serine protease